MSRESIRTAVAVTAAILAAAAAIPGVVAQAPEAAAAKNTPVASDGTEVSVVRSTTQSGENSSEGTGTLPPSPEAAETADQVWKLWELAPATGGVGIETIIGPDERVLVSPTTTYPARAVVLITFAAGRCTGWLYGPNIVATAGHCVHSGGANGAWQTNVRVFPGRNGNASPYGSCGARRLHSVQGWTRDKDERFDYGAIKLDCNIGNTVGWFGYWWQTATLNGRPTAISGYPGDKPLTQWRSNKSVGVTQARQVFYQNDTLGGMSGSGIVDNRPAGSPFCVGQCSMGIHAYGLHGAVPHSTNNHGTRIVQAVFDNLKAWKAAP